MEVQTEDFLVDFVNWGTATDFKVQLQGDIQLPETTAVPVKPRIDAAHIKPAKSRNDQYEAAFPSSMLCVPYKYDLKIVGDLDTVVNNSQFVLDLVDAETLKIPTASADEKQGVQLDYVEVSGKDIVLRFALLWCSFRFKKRAFRLKVSYKGGEIFVSSPFHTYARRRGTPYSCTPSPTCGRQYLQKETPATPASTPLISNSVWSPARVTSPQSVPTNRAVSSTPSIFFVAPPPSLSPPMQQGNNDLLKSFYERTQMAIQVMSALSPYEREAVNYYLSCNGSR